MVIDSEAKGGAFRLWPEEVTTDKEKFTKQPEIIAAIISVVGTIVGTLLISVLLGFLEGRVGLGPVVGVITFLLLLSIWVLLVFRWGLRLAGAAAAAMVVVGSVIFLLAVLAQANLGISLPSATTIAVVTITPTQPAGALPTRMLRPTLTPTVTRTPGPLERGEILGFCGDDVCIYGYGGGVTPVGAEMSVQDVIGSPSWSPDGLRFVFSACHKDDVRDPSECHPNLYIANRDGSNVTALVYNPMNPIIFPAWSPDGERVAYHDGGLLKIVRVDGTDARTLVQSSGEVMCPQGIAWSPDSQRIAWLGGNCRSQISDSLWVVNRDGSDVHLVFQSSDPLLAGGQIAWSPDGSSVAIMLQNRAVYLIDADCNSKPSGCDDSSRTVLDKFPEHWKHSFYPQWAGEEVAR